MPFLSFIVSLRQFPGIMRLFKNIFYRALLCLTAFLFLARPAFAVTGDHPVLIISSYNPDAGQTSGNISDFMEEFQRLDGKCGVELENMNCKSFSEAPWWKQRMVGILSKYQGTKIPSLIILIGQEAWAAYLSLEDSVRGEVPVMVALASRNVVLLPEHGTDLKTWMPESLDFLDDFPDSPIKSGFIYQYDVEANIRMIKQLYPKTEHIAFISDNSYGGVTLQAHVVKEMRKFPELGLILLDGRVNTIYTISDKLHALPPNTALLMGTWRVDMNDGYFMRNATYAMMEAAPDLPAFSITSAGIGYWALGGVVPHYRPLGKGLAQQAVRLLKNPEKAMLEIIPTQTVMDGKLIKEKDLDISSLSGPVELVNVTPSFYEQYKYHIWGIAAVLLSLLVGLFVSLYFYYHTKKLKDELEVSEASLREAKERAEEANRLKSAFLANMSHEIRTPLNAIVGFSSLMVDTEDMEERRQYMDIVEENNDLLLQLISDILDLSKIEAGTFDFTEREVDVNLLCEDIVLAMRMKARPNVEILFDRHLPECRIMSDRNRLHQVISNFVNNALKFTEEGNIRVGYDQLDEAHLRFYIADTGIGIEPEMQNEIFERFVKLNSFVHGTGLGLSICRSIVEQLGGEIGVDSEPEKGSCFWFTLPIK